VAVKVLILGGTSEARQLAERLAARPDYQVTTSLAGRTKSPRRPTGDLRTGGFGGGEGLAAYLEEEGIDLVIDATHPFATRISANAAAACVATGTRRLMLVRAPWVVGADDRWIDADDTADAARRLAEIDGPVFLAIGRQELAAFTALADRTVVARMVDPPEGRLALPNARIVVGRGPFALADEKALLAEHDIAVLVAKNAGGESGRAKLVAAAELGLPVIMIRRPPPPEGDRVATVEEALDKI
jgi:precorrin-6A/cobalt-precorrin-6A reductase